MKELILLAVQAIVDSPAAVFVVEKETPEITTYTVYTEPSEAGQAIGREGCNANALRQIVKSMAMKQRKRVHIDIVG